jgi:tetratricopeptide (TPR) repeat protein
MHLRFACAVGLAALVAAAPAGAAKSKVAEKKIPVTSAVPEAREAYLRGRDLQEKLRAADARVAFQEAAAKDPKMALAQLGLANTAPTGKDFFAALERAVALAPAASDGERLQIEALQAGVEGRVAQQKQLLDKLVKLYPGDERAHNGLGNWHFGQQEYEKAAAAFKRSIALNPEFSQPYNQLGYVLRFMEKFDEAEQAFKKYVELIPDDPNPHDSYAELLMKVGRFDESIAHYQKALAVDPGFVASYIGIGNNQMFQGKGEEARKTFATLMSKARDLGQKRQAHIWTAISWVHDGQTDKAMAEVEKMRQTDLTENDLSNLAGTYNFGAEILLEAGRVDDAKKWFGEQLAAIDKARVPEEVKQAQQRNSHYDYGRVALAKGDLDGAKKHADEYDRKVAEKKIRFELQQAHELRGRIALAEKKPAVAVKALAKANPQDPRALFLLAQALQASGDAKHARKIAKRAADFNGLAGINYAVVRAKAKAMLDDLG